MQFNSAIALAVLTFTTSAVAQGWDYYGDNGLYAREVIDDEYDSILSIREEAYLEGYMHGLVGRAGNGLVADAKAVNSDAARLSQDRGAARNAQNRENSDVKKFTADGKITGAESKALAADSRRLSADKAKVGGDKKALKNDKAKLSKAAAKARRDLEFDDEFDFYDY